MPAPCAMAVENLRAVLRLAEDGAHACASSPNRSARRSAAGFGSWPGIAFDEAQRRDAEAIVVVLPSVVEDDHIALRAAGWCRSARGSSRSARRGARCTRRHCARYACACCGIDGNQRVANLADVRLGHHRIHPEMRIVVLHRQAFGADDDVQVVRAGVVQQTVEPRFQAGAVFDEHVSIGNGRDVLRRRLRRFPATRRPARCS